MVGWSDWLNDVHGRRKVWNWARNGARGPGEAVGEAFEATLDEIVCELERSLFYEGVRGVLRRRVSGRGERRVL